MAARDDSRRDAEYEDVARNGIERDDNARGDGGHEALALGDGAARAGNDHDGARRYDDTGHDGPVHADLDALMAALLDDPLPEEALRDAEFMAARDAA
ncbi:MAG TPA: hypothetical protein VLG91_11920, partial [Streptomyces sp.]|nr:hypothetical protein [Streptomyces sp.]